MRIKYQIFLSLLLSSIVVIGLLAVFSSWSLNRGFSRYVIDSEMSQLQSFTTELVARYEEESSWQWIENDPDEFRELVYQHVRSRPGPGAPKPPPRAGPRSGPSPGFHQPPDETRMASGEQIKRGPSLRPPDSRGGKGPGNKRRFWLVNADKRSLFGDLPKDTDLVWEPISSRGTTIAYLGFHQPRGIPAGLENLFLNRQMRNYAFAALALAMLSVVMALLLSDRIVKPLQAVNRVVARLSGGDYQQRLNTHRRDELGDLSRHIDQLALALEKNQSSRRRWMAEIAHELRTPLAILQGELEALQDGVKDFNRDAVDSLHSETRRLGLLINDLHELSMSDIGAMNYQLGKVDLSGLISQRLDMARQQMEQTELDVTFDADTVFALVNGDADRLAQLIDNLIQNSIRYTDSGGQIDISILNHTDRIELFWSDSSPGVSDEQLKQLFDPLFRAEDSRNRAYGGSGLGLSIVRRIVEAHQGTVDAHHSDSGGLSIRITLPAIDPLLDL